MNGRPARVAVASPLRLGRFRARRSLPGGTLPRGSRGLLLGGVRLRCLTWLRASSLDTLLAAGADPVESDALSLRAGQLSSKRSRARLTSALERAAELADRQPAPPSLSKPLIRRAEVRACRSLLMDLVERLHDDHPMSVRGLAMTSMLVRDGASPLYYNRAPCSLSEAAGSAVIALEPPPAIGGSNGTTSPRHPSPWA